jgi:hypothetical protein
VDSILFCQVGARILCAARTSYRLLLVDSEIFSKLWNWFCFLDLVKQTFNLDLSSSAADIVIADIKWCGIQILSIVLKTSCIPTPHFIIGAKEALTCSFRLVLFNHLSKMLILKLKSIQFANSYIFILLLPSSAGRSSVKIHHWRRLAGILSHLNKIS